MKIDYPGNIVPRPLINMKSPTSQTPNALYSAIRNPQSSFPLSPRLPVALSVAIKIDYPGNIVSRPLIKIKNPTSQTPNALYSAIRIPHSKIPIFA